MRILDNVVLDCDAFKALSSHTRTDILKRLDARPMTVTDLARVLKISKSSAFKHLEKLVEVGLIEKRDDPRKWVYYRITGKGAHILHPENVRVSIFLSWAIVLIGVTLVALAFYLVWFLLPATPLSSTTLSVSSVVGVLLLMAGGSLILKNPVRSRVRNDDEGLIGQSIDN